jgi:hypothetical protein
MAVECRSRHAIVTDRPRISVLTAGNSVMILTAKSKPGKDAGSSYPEDTGATEDAVRRSFAAARARSYFRPGAP